MYNELLDMQNIGAKVDPFAAGKCITNFERVPVIRNALGN